MQDVVVIGGSYAGMAAALQLLRARRKILVIDAGQRRNRSASHSYGFLGQDGVDPSRIWANARKQLAAYPTLTWFEGRAVKITGQKDDFDIRTEDGAGFAARRILFANGVTDQLPDIPGLAERWGKSVFHCPYCHGYELNQGRIGVIATGPMSVHQAQLIPEWGEVTFLTNGAVSPSRDEHDDLLRRGVMIEETLIDRIEGDAELVLRDWRRLAFAGLFTASRTSPASPLAQATGCRLKETPMGSQIEVNAANETSIPGIFACGDTARVPHSVSLAVGDAAWAGAQLHRSLVWPES